MNRNYLLITLGHGSSAIFVDNENSIRKPSIIGYEQERLSRIKADSQFPVDAINEIMHNVTPKKILGCTILISHWFNFTDDDNMPNKYITEKDMYWLKQISENIKFVSPEFTHHDAHAYSAYAFYKYHCKPENISHTPVHCIVADGFGNDEEVLSIYSVDLSNPENKPKCIYRVNEYYNSLGLFYQYATSFVGMKENQDEYKFLGYEAHIDEVLDEAIIKSTLGHHIGSFVDMFIDHILKGTDKPRIINKKHSIIDFNKLSDVKAFWHSMFRNVLNDVPEIDNCTSFNARCVIAYVIQQTIEAVMVAIVKEFGITNLCVAGGCFYNVKLNNALLKAVPGYFSAMPLAGDQGAAIGMYAAEENVPQFPFTSLSWGQRRLYNFEKLAKCNPNIHYIRCEDIHDFNDAACYVAKLIANDNIVDLVVGNMEFGPRALCNTSTLFLPTAANVAYNNHMNMRNEVMPCAPVCTYSNAIKLFGDDIKRVIGSDKFMICTHEYTRSYSKQYGGVMHKKTCEYVYTGRPQIVNDNSFMYDVLIKVEELTDVKCLVNTSFNVHGQPIVFDTSEILQNYNFQVEHSGDKTPILVVINN